MGRIGQIAWNKGLKHSEETRKKISKSLIGLPVWNKGLTGEDYISHYKYGIGVKKGSEGAKRISIAKLGNMNPMWKGNKVQYHALHSWVKRHKPKPDFCEGCNFNTPYDLANISGKYNRDVSDYKWLCRKCHMLEDGRINNLKQYAKEELYVSI